MKVKNESKGHIFAILTVFIWGTTFISTKILLVDFSPVELLIYRFLIGFLALSLVVPKRFKWTGWKRELILAVAGLCGVILYFLLENIALTFTLASNVGVIISVAPIFTVLFSKLFGSEEKLSRHFFLGFLIAVTGIILINFNSSQLLKLNPTGDILAVLAAIVWAIYALLTKKISHWGYNTIQTTRRTFGHGLFFMLPSSLLLPFDWPLDKVLEPIYLLNILFLGLGASAFCFVSWNTAVKILGAIKTSNYIYLVPAITVVTSILVLQEPVSWLSIFGTLLTLVGLILSEKKEATALPTKIKRI